MKNKTDYRWVIKIIAMSICISAVFNFLSSEILDGAGFFLAVIVLLIFIVIGIIFDMVGMADASAVEVPFHAMSSHRVKGAAESIKLVRNAEKVSSVCNDVVGDIAGIISGSTGAAIVANLVRDMSLYSMLISGVVSGLVAGLTIGGKALGKTVAVNKSTEIVLTCGKIISIFKSLFKRK